MKTFTKVILSVALGAIIVLSIVVASVAWFTSNPEANTSEVTLESARTFTVSFDKNNPGSTFNYEGQKGNAATGSDAPYVYEEGGGFAINISLTAETGEYRAFIKVEFGTVTIETYVPGMGTISDVLMSDLFHVEARIYEPTNDTEGEVIYVKDPIGKYMRKAASGDTLLPHYRLISTNPIANDGVVMDDSDPTKPEYFGQGTYYLDFTYTFLSEDAYDVWKAAVAGEASFDDVVGYELAASGDYIGVVNYVPYEAKYHYGMTRYTKSATADGNGNYTYEESAEGAYVRVISEYRNQGVKTYHAIEDPTTHEIIRYSNSENGEFNYIKVGDSNTYVLFKRYKQVDGFSYSDDKFRGATYTFKVNCSVEEEVVSE